MPACSNLAIKIWRNDYWLLKFYCNAHAVYNKQHTIAQDSQPLKLMNQTWKWLLDYEQICGRIHVLLCSTLICIMFFKLSLSLVNSVSHTVLKTEMAASISRLTKFRSDWVVSLIMIRPKRKFIVLSAHYAWHYNSRRVSSCLLYIIKSLLSLTSCDHCVMIVSILQKTIMDFFPNIIIQ